MSIRLSVCSHLVRQTRCLVVFLLPLQVQTMGRRRRNRQNRNNSSNNKSQSTLLLFNVCMQWTPKSIVHGKQTGSFWNAGEVRWMAIDKRGTKYEKLIHLLAPPRPLYEKYRLNFCFLRPSCASSQSDNPLKNHTSTSLTRLLAVSTGWPTRGVRSSVVAIIPALGWFYLIHLRFHGNIDWSRMCFENRYLTIF